jgi:hypothetical protein
VTYAWDANTLRRLRAVDLVKSLLGKGGTTDFQVRQWGIQRTRKSVVPLNQQPAWLRDARSVKLTSRELRFRVRLSVESLCLESDGSIECDRILADVAALHLSRGHEPGSLSR